MESIIQLKEEDISLLIKGEEEILNQVKKNAYDYGISEGARYYNSHGKTQNQEEYMQKIINGYLKMIVYKSFIGKGLSGEKMLKKAESTIKKYDKNKNLKEIKFRVQEGFLKVNS